MVNILYMPKLHHFKISYIYHWVNWGLKNSIQFVQSCAEICLIYVKYWRQVRSRSFFKFLTMFIFLYVIVVIVTETNQCSQEERMAPFTTCMCIYIRYVYLLLETLIFVTPLGIDTVEKHHVFFTFFFKSK